jgi:hypothetical protein
MKTNFERNRILGHRYGGGAHTPPATVYFALYTAAPTVSGGGTEVSGGSYARAAVPNDNMHFTNPPVAGVTANLLAIAFAQATALWGTVVAVGVFDALSGGNLLDFQTMTTPRTINSGDTFSIAVGQAQFTET